MQPGKSIHQAAHPAGWEEMDRGKKTKNQLYTANKRRVLCESLDFLTKFTSGIPHISAFGIWIIPHKNVICNLFDTKNFFSFYHDVKYRC